MSRNLRRVGGEDEEEGERCEAYRKVCLLTPTVATSLMEARFQRPLGPKVGVEVVSVMKHAARIERVNFILELRWKVNTSWCGVEEI